MKGKLQKENGAIMLEGMIIVVLTLFILIWILGVGFLFYQKYLVTAITNDAAKKVAATYYNPESDLIIGYIDASQLPNRDLYRAFSNAANGNSIDTVALDKADAYINYRLKKTNFVGTVKNVEVEFKLVPDSLLRKHVEIKTRVLFKTPFGEIFNMFGMNRNATYESVGRAECIDIHDYISTVDFAKYQMDTVGAESSLGKMLKSLVKLYNHVYAEK